MQKTTTKERVYGLDILRCLAILLVVFAHGGHGESMLPKPVNAAFNYFSLDGVSIFFVLSGFLIGGILIKILETTPANFNSLLQFWKRRWWRTLPNYFLILATLTVIHTVIFKTISFADAGPYVVFSQNLFYPHPGFFQEAWSLAVEEWFYLLIPAILFTLAGIAKFSVKKAVLSTIFMVLFGVTCLRLCRFMALQGIVLDVYDWDHIFRKQVFTRLDSLVYGVLGAYLYAYHHTWWLTNKNGLLYTGILLLVLNTIAEGYYFTNTGNQLPGVYITVLSFSVSSAATLCVLPYLNSIQCGTGLVYRLVTTTAIISYAMYLVNFTFVKNDLVGHIPLNFLPPLLRLLVKYILYWILTLSLSTLIYRYFEAPLTRLRDK